MVDEARDRHATTPALARGEVVVSSQASLPTVSLNDTILPADEIIDSVRRQDRYLPLGELGRGGMGQVTALFDRVLGRTVAGKTVLDVRLRALLLNEAKICAQLEHPSIVPVYDVEVGADGTPRYMMRVIEGGTFRELMKQSAGRRSVSLAQLLGVLRQVCLAVDYAHSRGVVHRDLKPENVIVGHFGEVYVLDWGVAHVMQAHQLHGSFEGVRETAMAGSPGYMAPEQAMGESISPRTDVFALGVILHEILSGERPFADEDLPSMLRRINAPPAPAPSRRSPTPVPDFDDLVVASLARDPLSRPPTARVLADAIDRYLDGERVRAERAREAAREAQVGDDALAVSLALRQQAAALRTEADDALARLKSWEPVDAKLAAWEARQEAQGLEAESARARARAEAAFARAIACVPGHAEARRGLAQLHFHQFLDAEAASQPDHMAHHLELARAYDDGALAMELSDQGSLSVESLPEGASIAVARYEAKGPLLVEGRALPLGAAPITGQLLASGSYVVTARRGGRELRYPLLLERARHHRLRLAMPPTGAAPEGMIVVPGGPFRAATGRSAKLVTERLPDFAIARFPVTFREYIRFWESIDDAGERQRRLPLYEGEPMFHRDGGVYRIHEGHVEGEGRKRVPVERELDLPIAAVTWYDAVAYAEWASRGLGAPLRLPTEREWQKAMRGADGRPFPMGTELDPAFAKLRESRPELSQCEPVGAFALDASPYGVRDLAGGVSDWTSTSPDGLELTGRDGEGVPEHDQQVAFGCGWHWGNVQPRRHRVLLMIGRRTTSTGFRLALSLDPALGSDLTVEAMR